MGAERSVYVRFTRSADLLEIREDYMRGGERFVEPGFYGHESLVRILGKLAPLVFPARMEVYGEGSCGGVFSSYIVDACAGEKYYMVEEALNSLGDVVWEVFKQRCLGVVNYDGVVKNLPDRIERGYVILRPIRFKDITVRLSLARNWLWDYDWEKSCLAERRLFHKTENAIIIEGAGVERFYQQLKTGFVKHRRHYSLFCRKTRKPQAKTECGGFRTGWYGNGLLIKNLAGTQIDVQYPCGKWCWDKHEKKECTVTLDQTLQNIFLGDNE